MDMCDNVGLYDLDITDSRPQVAKVCCWLIVKINFNLLSWVLIYLCNKCSAYSTKYYKKNTIFAQMGYL